MSIGDLNALTCAKKGQPGKPGVQDYLCKTQTRLDGIVKGKGQVEQFVAMPVEQGQDNGKQFVGKVSYDAGCRFGQFDE